MFLIANTKLVAVFCKLFLLSTKDIGGKVLGSILFRILGQSLFSLIILLRHHDSGELAVKADRKKDMSVARQFHSVFLCTCTH